MLRTRERRGLPFQQTTSHQSGFAALYRTSERRTHRRMEKTYVAIDLKSFYASVECVERELDPLRTNLVVADA